MQVGQQSFSLLHGTIVRRSAQNDGVDRDVYRQRRFRCVMYWDTVGLENLGLCVRCRGMGCYRCREVAEDARDDRARSGTNLPSLSCLRRL
jgi:hypothetical protein